MPPSTGGCRPGGAERGQALVLGTLLLGVLLVLLLAVPALALVFAVRAGAASAADAAALACASQAEVTVELDARGAVYGREAAVDPAAGSAAAALTWSANAAGVRGLRTIAFAASAAGADCTVRAQVAVADAALAALGWPRFEIGVSAEARAYAVAP